MNRDSNRFAIYGARFAGLLPPETPSRSEIIIPQHLIQAESVGSFLGYGMCLTTAVAGLPCVRDPLPALGADAIDRLQFGGSVLDHG